MTEQDYLTGTIARWALRPWELVRECFGVQPDTFQDEALHLIAKPETRRLALKACKGPGKTALLAWVMLWFLATRWQCRIGATSITEANIDANLWPELNKWMQRSSFFTEAFAWSKSAVVRRSDPGAWYAQKRTWPKHGDEQTQKDALAGLHADHVMFVLDESGGIPQAVMVTAEAIEATHGQETKILQAGNPTHNTGPLHRACHADAALWRVIQITGDPDNPKRSQRISLEWARQQIASYGRDNPWVMVNVLGEFPPSSINALLGYEEVNAAMQRHLRLDQYRWAQKRIGVDVARFGDDRTVIFPRQGPAAFRPDVLRQQDTVQIAARVARGIEAWGAELVLVDDTGHWGHGVIDNLRAASYPVIPVMYSDPAPDPRYRNVRSWIWMKMAEWVKAGGALPPVPEMVAELTEPTYTFLGGQFVVEPKELVKERLQRSPDLADALATTFAMPDMPAKVIQELTGRQHAATEFDPFEVQQAARDFEPYGWLRAA